MNFFNEVYAKPTTNTILPITMNKCKGVQIEENKLAKDYSFLSTNPEDKIINVDFTNILSCIRSKTLIIQQELRNIEQQISACSSECVLSALPKLNETKIKLMVELKPLEMHYEIIHIIQKTNINEIKVKTNIGELFIATILYKEQSNRVFSPTKIKYSFSEENARVIEQETVKKFNIALKTSLQSNFYGEIGADFEILSGKVGGSLSMGLEVDGGVAFENKERTIHSDKTEIGIEKIIEKYNVSGAVGIKFLKQFNGVNQSSIMYLEKQNINALTLETTSKNK